MDTLSFAAGYALGRKKGGGGHSIFQDILKYSTKVGEFEINSTYKYTFHLWVNERNELGHGISNFQADYNTINNQVANYTFVTAFYRAADVFSIAWENDTPLFAVHDGTAGNYPISYGETFRHYGTTTEQAFYIKDDYQWDTANLPAYGDDLYLNFTDGGSTGRVFSHYIYMPFSGLPTIDVTYLYYSYSYSGDESEFPTIYLDSSRTQTQYYPQSLYCFGIRTPIYSDMSETEVRKKYFGDILKAIYKTSGCTFKNLPYEDPVILTP